MNLVNFHKYEKNIPYVAEVPVIHESQGNYADYFVAICGDQYNRYNFLVRYIDTKEEFNIIIKEKRIEDWTIKEGSTGSQRGRPYLQNQLKFFAIGKIIGTNKYVYLKSINSYGTKIFDKLIINETKQVEVFDITVTNNSITKFEKPKYDLDKNLIFTVSFYIEYRYETFRRSEFGKLRDKILSKENIDCNSESDNDSNYYESD